MELNQMYAVLMQNHKEIALSTIVNNIPNVRIINYFFSIKQPNTLFFITKRDTKKTDEFSKNTKVAFTTIPQTGNAHIRVVDATVESSNMDILELRVKFNLKIIPFWESEHVKTDMLQVYEIHFNVAQVVVNSEISGVVDITNGEATILEV